MWYEIKYVKTNHICYVIRTSLTPRRWVFITVVNSVIHHMFQIKKKWRRIICVKINVDYKWPEIYTAETTRLRDCLLSVCQPTVVLHSNTDLDIIGLHVWISIWLIEKIKISHFDICVWIKKKYHWVVVLKVYWIVFLWNVHCTT